MRGWVAQQSGAHKTNRHHDRRAEENACLGPAVGKTITRPPGPPLGQDRRRMNATTRQRRGLSERFRGHGPGYSYAGGRSRIRTIRRWRSATSMGKERDEETKSALRTRAASPTEPPATRTCCCRSREHRTEPESG